MCPVYTIALLGKEDAGTSERIRDWQITPQSELRDFRSAARKKKKTKKPGFQS